MTNINRVCLKKVAALLCAVVFSFIVVAQPKITSFTPASGQIGATVTITGSGFNTTPTNNLVYFGTVKATVSTASSNSLTVTVPAGAGFDYISVVNGFYTGYSLLPFNTTFPNGAGDFSSNSFSSKLDITTSANPYSVSTGDLDGDGKPDLVVANTGANSISIFRSTSAAQTISFATKIDLPTGKSPHRICIADVSGDGKPELIVTNYDDNTISIFKNNSVSGTISFAAKADFATGANPETVAAGDFDGDGFPDLVVTNNGSTSISILRNTLAASGGISYTTKTDIAYGGSPAGVAVGDLDGDGKPEIITTNVMSNDLSVFRNTSTPGTFSFAVHANFFAYLSPQGVKVADIDGDGKPELIAGGNQTIAVLRNTSAPGNISFATAVSVSTVPDVFATIADLDGDGKPDIAASAQFSHEAYILRNISTIGSIQFAPGQFDSAGADPICISAADFDADGKADLVLANVTGTSVSILRNQANEPRITSYSPLGGCAVSGSIIMVYGSKFTNTVMVQRDGQSESFNIISDSVLQVFVQGPVTNTISVTNNYGTGRFNIPPPVITSFTPVAASPGTVVTITGKYLCGATAVSMGGVACVAFTVNADSSIAAIVGPGASGNVNVTTIRGSGSLPGFTFIPLPVILSFTPKSGPVGTTVTITGKNFSPQAFNDVVYFGAVRAPVITASANTLTVAVPAGASYQPISITVKEHNLSAYAQQAFVTTFGTGKTIDSSSFRRKDTAAITGQFPLRSIIKDFDLDGLADLATVDFVDGSLSVIRNTSTHGSLSFATKNTLSIGNSQSQTSSVSSSDFDGDGRNDLVAVNKMDTNIVILKNIGGPGHASFFPGATLKAGYGSWPSVVVSGDLDGDGRPDLVVLNDQYGRPTLFRNTTISGNISFDPPVFVYGFSGMTSAVLTDFDGDGKPDIAITVNGSNQLLILINDSKPGIISFINHIIYPTGFGPTSITVGDVDGDNLPDIAFLNRGNNSFSVMRNLSTVGNISFAASVDFPISSETGNVPMDGAVLNDVNGDGKPDMCLATPLTVKLLKNISSPGNINFSAPVLFNMPSGYNGNYISVNDLNNDGRPDIAVISQNSTNATVFLNQIDSASTPAITSFIPTSAGYGDTVKIKGTKFTGTTAVGFGGIPAIYYKVISDSLIAAVVGTGASGKLTVTNTSGTATMDGFLYAMPLIISFTPTSATNGAIVTIKGKYFSNTNAVSLGGTQVASFTVVSDTVITAVVGMGSTGNVSVTTPSGVSETGIFTFIPGAIPQLISFSPKQGTMGTQIQIIGRNLSSTTFVSFGGTPATSFQVSSDTIILATVGAGASGAVLVRTSGGTDTLPGFIFVSAPPHIISFTPSSAGTGDGVIIKGQHFTGTTTVSFGGTAASSFTILSDSSLQAFVGNGASGYVRVISPGGSDSTGGFTFVSTPSVPSIHSFAPASGTTGTSVTIKGSHLGGTTAVLFGNVNASSFSVVSDSVITAIVGSGASGAVYIISGNNNKDSLAGFTYINNNLPPVIHSFVPDHAKQGDLVTINGIYFTNTTSVRFGNIPATLFTIVSDSVITATVGAGESGYVYVETSYSIDSLNGFVFITASPAPTIHGFTPTNGNTGTAVAISGTHFTGVTSVNFGGTAASSFAIISDSLIVAVVGKGASGNVSVTSPSGTASDSGFVFTAGLAPFPNPASHNITINFPLSSTPSQITLSDMTGRLLMTVQVNPNTTSTTINISTIKPGIYILSWSNGANKMRKTIMIE